MNPTPRTSRKSAAEKNIRCNKIQKEKHESNAVKNGRVYDLTYEYFGMSATFKYPQALEELQPILYPESDADTQKAKENSDKAQKDAKDSGASEKYDEIQKSK